MQRREFLARNALAHQMQTSESEAGQPGSNPNPRNTPMKRLNLTLLLVLLGTSLAFAAGLISKQAAENDALKAVGGGTVQQATLDSEGGKRVWSVDITGSTNEYEVWVDAHTGAILKIITQPLSPTELISKAQAEQDALAAVGGGEVLQAALDTTGTNDRKVWSVDIVGSNNEYEVLVDAHTSAIVKIITQPLESMSMAPCRFLTKAKAERIALAAVSGGKVMSAVLEKNDNPVDWSVDIQHSDGQDYEVKVDACTGKVLQIIVGG
jgi:uncharacterized membrane protein YkoI